jgi:hypothetical protein
MQLQKLLLDEFHRKIKEVEGAQIEVPPCCTTRKYRIGWFTYTYGGAANGIPRYSTRFPTDFP